MFRELFTEGNDTKKLRLAMAKKLKNYKSDFKKAGLDFDGAIDDFLDHLNQTGEKFNEVDWDELAQIAIDSAKSNKQ